MKVSWKSLENFSRNAANGQTNRQTGGRRWKNTASTAVQQFKYN